MAQVIEEKWMFTIKRFPDGRSFATAPFMIGQNYAKPKEQKVQPKGMETETVNTEKKDLFKV
jgi:hypothetical protein